MFLPLYKYQFKKKEVFPKFKSINFHISEISPVKFRADSTQVLQMRLQTEVPCVHTHEKQSHMHAKDPVVHVRVWRIMETPK